MVNFNKLKEAYNRVDWLVAEEVKDNRAYVVKEVRRLIQEFMVDNEPTPKKNTFNIWDFAANDDMRPVLNGVFHDKVLKYAVASDAHTLVADMDLYDESKADPVERTLNSIEGWRPVDKYDNFIEGRYPNWKNVIPDKAEGYKTYHVSIKEVDEYIKKCNSYMKLNGLTGKYAQIPMFNVPETEAWYSAPLLRTFLVASGEEINICAPNKAAVYWGERRLAIIMPMLYDKGADRGDGIYLTSL